MVLLVTRLQAAGYWVLTDFMVASSNLSRARSKALALARKRFADYLFFIDDDMAFDADIVETMISRDKSIVAANCVTKEPNVRPTAYGMDRKPISSVGKTGIERVRVVGMGAVLIRLKDIKDVQEPLFSVVWNPSAQDYIGEDHFFFHRMEEAGVEVWVDHDVSKKISHVGDYCYRFNEPA